MNKALVLLSGGLDSLTALSEAKKKYHVLLTLTFDYGQKASKRELRAAKLIARHYGVPNKVIKLSWLKEITSTALVNRSKKIPMLLSPEQGNKQTAAAVWVPNRNGVFLNIAAAYAESYGAGVLITGFNAEEAKTFPDNSLAFCESADRFFSFSTLRKVKVLNFFYNFNKAQIFQTALKNKAPLEYVWPCYAGGWQMCGKCESCVRYARAKNEALSRKAKK